MPTPSIPFTRAAVPDRVAPSNPVGQLGARTVFQRHPVIAGLLVGGASRRMGRPKQMLTLDHRSLGEIAAECVATVAAGVVLLGDGHVAPALEDLPRLPDADGIHGPLAGLASALRWAPDAAWLVTACDMPWIAPIAVQWLLDQRRPRCAAVVPRTSDGRIHPLLAIYEPQAARLVEDLIRNGKSAPRLLADHPAVETPVVPGELEHHWSNANTPQQWARVLSGPYVRRCARPGFGRPPVCSFLPRARTRRR